jgi:putative ABC transport system permease protein
MFAAPFNEGSAWTSEDDSQAAHVAVISEELNNKAFGGKNSIGKTILLGSTEFRIVGVLAQWQVTPHFYDLSSGIYSEREMVFLPFEAARALKLRFQGDTECWSSGLDVINQHDWLEKLWSGTTNCAWIQYWVQLRTQAERDRYADYIASYVGNQVESGRFLRHEKGALYGTMKWLDMQKVVPKNVRLQTAIALSFLLVCLVNTVGLMLAKFMGNGQSIAVRRALGATRRDIFLQFLVEAASVGLIGGFLGAVLSVAGLALVRMQPLEYAPLAHIDALMLTAAILLSLTVTIAAGMLPAWLVCQAQPSRALRAN